MSHPTARALAGLVAAGMLLAGCSSDPGSVPATSPATPNTSAEGEPSVSASPSATLTAEEQQAVEEATEAVRRYEQMFYDILSDPEPNLNDMNNVAAQPQLALDLKGLQEIFAAGETTIHATGPVTIASVESGQVNLDDDPLAVVLTVCVDRSKNSGTESGDSWTGRRELARYRVVKTTYLPAPGWAVARVLPPKGFEQPQPC